MWETKLLTTKFCWTTNFGNKQKAIQNVMADGQTDGQTEEQTDRQTDRRTDQPKTRQKFVGQFVEKTFCEKQNC